MNTRDDILQETCRLLQDEKIEFMVVGALAVSAHGEPRATKDVDIVVALPFEQRGDVARILHEKGWPWKEWIDPQWGKRLMTRHPSNMRIEIFFAPQHELFDREFSRRTWVDYEGMKIPFISPEDLILRKLVNTRIRCGQDYDDAISVILGQRDKLDTAYIKHHCAVHRVCELFEKALEAARALWENEDQGWERSGTDDPPPP